VEVDEHAGGQARKSFEDDVIDLAPDLDGVRRVDEKDVIGRESFEVLGGQVGG